MASVEATHDIPIVTTKQEPDPKSVEAGKKLAAISKQAKEGRRERGKQLEQRSLSPYHQVGLC